MCAFEAMEAAEAAGAAVAAGSSAAGAAFSSTTAAVAAAAGPDKMAELVPSDEEEVLTPPKKVRRLSRARRKHTQAHLAPFVTVHLSASWADFNNENGAVRPLVVLNDAKALWVPLDDVPWLLNMLHEERSNGFVAPAAPAAVAATPEVPGICWIFRDSCWQGRKRLSDGSFAVKRVHVTRRAKHGGYEDAKEAALREIEAWAKMPE
jgi:hypothetical protein